MKPREASLSHETLTRVLDYDPATGVFVWKERTSNRVKVGAAAGNVTPFGYMSIQLLGWAYLAHRLAWFYVHGVWPKEEVDHRDGDGINNKLSNLREANSSQNKMNRRPRPETKVGLKGVYLHKENPPQYRARIKSADGKVHHLGLFPTAEEAHAAYAAASHKYHGEYGRST
jgi:hypothetical protein